MLHAWIDTWLAPEFADWNLEAQLRGVRCPVLAIHGEHDEYGSMAHPRRIAVGVPGPSRIEALDCGHVPHREREQVVLDLVARFLA